MPNEAADLLSQNVNDTDGIKSGQVKQDTVSNYFVQSDYRIHPKISLIKVEQRNLGSALVLGHSTHGIIGLVAGNQLGTGTVSPYTTLYENAQDSNITDVGKALIAAWINGESPDPPAYIAIGDGTTPYIESQTALVNELGSRATAVKDYSGAMTITFNAAITDITASSIKEVGIFEEASGGNMWFRHVLSVPIAGIDYQYQFTLTMILEDATPGNSLVTYDGLNQIRNFIGGGFASVPTYTEWNNSTKNVDFIHIPVGEILFMKMEDDAATKTVTDSSGYGLYGVAYQDTEDISTTGNGFSFNGSSDYVRVEDHPTLNITGAIGVSAWVNIDSGGSGIRIIAGKWDSGIVGKEWNVHVTASNEIAFAVSNDGSTNNAIVTTDDAITLDTWKHILVTFYSQNVYIYIDGVLQNTTTTGTIPTSIYNGAADLTIGSQLISDSPSLYFQGDLDDVRIFKRIMFIQDARNLYNSTTELKWDNGKPYLVGHWKMNDNAATTDVLDSSGLSNDGTADQNTEDITVVGKINSALDFNGSGDEVVIPYSADFDFGKGISASAWIKHDNTTGDQAIVGRWAYGANKREWALYNHGGKLRFIVSTNGTDNAYWEADDTLPVDTGWHHVAVVFFNGLVTMYFDGAAIDGTYSTTLPTIVNLDNGDGNIGSLGGTASYFNGSIDDVRIYRGVLDSDQIAFLYNDDDGTEVLYNSEQRNAFDRQIRTANVVTFETQLELTELNGVAIFKSGNFSASTEGKIFGETRYGRIPKTGLFQVYEIDRYTVR